VSRLLLALVFAAALVAPCSAAAQVGEGARAFARYGCASCHQDVGAPVSAGRSCVGCHQRVVAAPRSAFGRQPRVEHYVHAPDLRRVTRRLRERYLVRFLQDPHDVRPRMEETMPRLPVTEADARAIVAFLREGAGELAVPRGPAPDMANVARGRDVFRRAGCAACHEVGNLDLGVRLPPEALAGLARPAIEAPNLRFVRDRMDPDVALAWIRDPRSVDPESQMPAPELGAEDARAVRDFLFLASAGAPATPPPTPTRESLAPLGRIVRYADVRVLFQRSCIHCHAHADARAASAFGFAPSSLDLSSAEGVRAGVLLPDGTRRSILTPDGSGVPPLLSRLLRRHEEAVRDVTAPGRDPLGPVARAVPVEPPGMPLGLPPLSIDDLRTIATWIAAGARD